MCGIVGYFSPDKSIESINQLHQATSLISHRGPDDEGYAVFDFSNHLHRKFCGPDSPDLIKSSVPLINTNYSLPHNLAFGFRRFSIVDLTEKGHQPFWSRDENICLIFNGEVYNYVEIRAELIKLGYSFYTTCDTEVLMAGYQEWGMQVLNHCNGPIALVIYDKRENKLFMARDRIGKSPLYYAIHNGTLYWASEIKCILQLAKQSSFKVNEQAVFDYLNFGWRDLDNTTFWRGICTFPAASYSWLDTCKPVSHESISRQIKQYWQFPQSRLPKEQLSFDEAKERFHDLFLDAIRIRARADAKVAFSLSGGLDSSSIVAFAAQYLPQDLTAYTVHFPGHPSDEEEYAKSVYLRYKEKINYIKYTPKDTDFWELANDYIFLQEEPFHFVNAELFQAYFRHAYQNDYRVMIIGVGGDELLSGYRHFYIPLLVYLRNHRQYGQLFKNIFMQYGSLKSYQLKRKIKTLVNLIQKNDSVLPFTHSFFNASGESLALPFLKESPFSGIRCRQGHPNDYHQLSIGLMSNWLMNYWQRNSNKSHFGVPVEPRSPLLDYRIVEFAMSLPPEYLYNSGWTKFILRKVAHPLLPRKVAWRRKKRGFPFNSDVWFSNSKERIVKNMHSVSNNPYIDIEQCLSEYDTLARMNPTLLWRIVNFCLWWKKVIEKEDILI